MIQAYKAGINLLLQVYDSLLIEEVEDGSYLFKVELPLTEELCHWLLSMSFHVKVISPAFLAERIRSDLQMSLGMYQGTQSMANS